MLRSWRVRRAVLFVCGLGAALLAGSLLLAPDPGAAPAGAAQASARALARSAETLRAGVAAHDPGALAATVERAGAVLEQAHAALVRAGDTHRGLGVALAMIAAMNLLLWGALPRAPQEVEGG